MSGGEILTGRGSRDRTCVSGSQSPMPCHLAMPLHAFRVSAYCSRPDKYIKKRESWKQKRQRSSRSHRVSEGVGSQSCLPLLIRKGGAWSSRRSTVRPMKKADSHACNRKFPALVNVQQSLVLVSALSQEFLCKGVSAIAVRDGLSQDGPKATPSVCSSGAMPPTVPLCWVAANVICEDCWRHVSLSL